MISLSKTILLISVSSILTHADPLIKGSLKSLYSDILNSVLIESKEINVVPMGTIPRYSQTEIDSILKPFDAKSKTKFKSMLKQSKTKSYRVSLIPKNSPQGMSQGQIKLSYTETVGSEFEEPNNFITKESLVPVLEMSQFFFLKKGSGRKPEDWSAYYVPMPKCRDIVRKMKKKPDLYSPEELHLYCPDVVEIVSQ